MQLMLSLSKAFQIPMELQCRVGEREVDTPHTQREALQLEERSYFRQTQPAQKTQRRELRDERCGNIPNWVIHAASFRYRVFMHESRSLSDFSHLG